MRDAQPALERQLSSFAEALEARPSTLDPDDPATIELVQHWMTDIFALPGGAAALVARYAKDERPAIVRPLAFLLALAVNDREGAHALVATTFAMIEALRTPDPWPRLNLCTAVQRLLMFEAVEALDRSHATALARLLRDSLAAAPAVRATAAHVVADLFYRRRTSLLAGDIDSLAKLVIDLVDDPDDLTRQEAEGLRDFLRDG